jgi:hypothetical protein
MLSRRFEEQMMMQEQLPCKYAGSAAFMPLPIAAPGTEWWQWLYQKAFEEAQRDVLADRRARLIAASLN